MILNELQDKDEKLLGNEEQNNRLWYIDPDKLKPHEINGKIYGNDELDQLDEDLVESIRLNGQLEPIVINGRNNKIISGHRRWRALKKLKEQNEEIEAVCLVKIINTKSQEIEAIVEYNRYRKKTPLQVYRESKELYDIYTKRGEKRRIKNLPNLSNPKYVDELNSVHRGDEPGRSIDKLSEDVGVKRDTLAKIIRIGKRYDNADTDAIEIMNDVNSGILSIDAAIKMLKIIDISKSDEPEAEEARKLLNKIKNGLTTPNRAVELLEAYKEKSKKKVDSPSKEQVVTSTTSSNYLEVTANVIVADPNDLIQARKVKFTGAKDAVLFLWATTKNLKDRMELMREWGFKLNTIGVWDTGKHSGTWFNGVAEFLILGIKGQGLPTEYRPEIVFKKGSVNNVHKSEFVYDMVEKMFPGKDYLDPFRETGRKGWRKPVFVESFNDPQNSDEVKYDSSTNLNSISDNHKSANASMSDVHNSVNQTTTKRKAESSENSVQNIDEWLYVDNDNIKSSGDA